MKRFTLRTLLCLFPLAAVFYKVLDYLYSQKFRDDSVNWVCSLFY